MVIVAGQFDVDPDRREQFIAEREELMRASRAEAGCITYAFTADPIEKGRVLLFERWESKGALATHLAGMASSPSSATDIKVLSAEIQQYEISDVGPVGS